MHVETQPPAGKGEERQRDHNDDRRLPRVVRRDGGKPEVEAAAEQKPQR
jgi:hypothetical protein